MEKKYVYLFTEGNADMRELLGGKGANLAEMTRIEMCIRDRAGKASCPPTAVSAPPLPPFMAPA